MLPRLVLRSLTLVLALSMAGCGYIPRPVAGMPVGSPWESLPLRKWLAEDRAEPVALSFCAPPECRPALAVGVIRLTGRDADMTEALLKDPERLARGLRSPAGRDKPIKTRIAVTPVKDTPYPGFAIDLASAGDAAHAAYGEAFGKREGESLLVVLAVGQDADAVHKTARQVATRELGS